MPTTMPPKKPPYWPPSLSLQVLKKPQCAGKPHVSATAGPRFRPFRSLLFLPHIPGKPNRPVRLPTQCRAQCRHQASLRPRCKSSHTRDTSMSCSLPYSSSCLVWGLRSSEEGSRLASARRCTKTQTKMGATMRTKMGTAMRATDTRLGTDVISDDTIASVSCRNVTRKQTRALTTHRLACVQAATIRQLYPIEAPSR